MMMSLVVKYATVVVAHDDDDDDYIEPDGHEALATFPDIHAIDRPWVDSLRPWMQITTTMKMTVASGDDHDDHEVEDQARRTFQAEDVGIALDVLSFALWQGS